MSATLDAAAPRLPVVEQSVANTASPLLLERRHWLVALAVLVVFFAPYQTLVQTVLTDDSVRKGLQIDEYDMVWQQVGYGVGLLYGVFTALWLSGRIGARYTMTLGMLGFGQCDVRGLGRAWDVGAGAIRRWLFQDAGDGALPSHTLQTV